MWKKQTIGLIPFQITRLTSAWWEAKRVATGWVPESQLAAGVERRGQLHKLVGGKAGHGAEAAMLPGLAHLAAIGWRWGLLAIKC